MLKHYIEFFHPGIKASDVSVEEVSERDASKIKLPDNCFGFRFFDRSVIDVHGMTITGKRENISGCHYEGKKIPLENFKAFYESDPCFKAVIRNIEQRNLSAIIMTKFGQFIPVHIGDTLI